MSEEDGVIGTVELAQNPAPTQLDIALQRMMIEEYGEESREPMVSVARFSSAL